MCPFACAVVCALAGPNPGQHEKALRHMESCVTKCHSALFSQSEVLVAFWHQLHLASTSTRLQMQEKPCV